MTVTAPTVLLGPSRPRAGLWREEVLDRAGRLEAELAHCSTGDPMTRTAWAHVEAAVELTESRQGLAEWWSGSRTETCWRHLRRAEEALLDQGPGDEVRAKVADALTHARFYLGADDARTTSLATALDSGRPLSELLPVARIALAASHEASDRQHRERRTFVNSLRVTIALLVVLAGLLLAATATWEWRLVPALGDQQPEALVALALGFGALGALFSAVPSLAQMPSVTQAFSPIRTQAVLKVVVGAWSAVVGLMAVAAGLTTSAPAEADTTSVAGFALVAALFGASQEALTRFADHKAAGLDTGSTSGTSSTP